MTCAMPSEVSWVFGSSENRAAERAADEKIALLVV